MKTSRNHWLVILLLVVVSPLPAWGQAPNKLYSQVDLHRNDRLAKDSSVRSRPPGQTLTHTTPIGIKEGQPLHQQLSRLQVPDQTPTNTLVLAFFSAVFGALLFTGLFSATQYLLNRQAPYGWYAVYLTMTSIWLLHAMSIWSEEITRVPNIPIFLSLLVMLDYSILASYIRFVSYLLEVPQQQPRFERWLGYFYVYIALSVLASVTELFGVHSLQLYMATNFISYGGLLLFMFGVIRSKHVLKRYALTATILLVSGDWVAFLAGYTKLTTNNHLSQMPLFL
ncbi:hypothetical protein GCM10023189_49430 [Nibrella saemangeumensis]|uniref:7TM-DISM receptor extracellular domain-containing protein n=1 Tax=Nibrella saemangeumensis TaxID=1084526 RepID=A0ABP8NG49_9BACT